MRTKYWKTDAVFCEKFLDICEESINLHPKLTEEQKNIINTIFYSKFYECKKNGDKRKNVELANFRWNFKGFTKQEILSNKGEK